MIRGHKNEDLTELFDNFHGRIFMVHSGQLIEMKSMPYITSALCRRLASTIGKHVWLANWVHNVLR
jgi:hypothetical protein